MASSAACRCRNCKSSPDWAKARPEKRRNKNRTVSRRMVFSPVSRNATNHQVPLVVSTSGAASCSGKIQARAELRRIPVSRDTFKKHGESHGTSQNWRPGSKVRKPWYRVHSCSTARRNRMSAARSSSISKRNRSEARGERKEERGKTGLGTTLARAAFDWVAVGAPAQHAAGKVRGVLQAGLLQDDGGLR